jgi:hypothetical protein
MQLLFFIVFAIIIHGCMEFAGIDIGVYLCMLLWVVSLGLFMVMLPEDLPTG